MRQGLIFTLILTPFIALAQAVAPLGDAWPKLVEELKAKGIQKVGQLDLTKLQKEAKAITWELKSPGDVPAFADGRKSAYYNSKTKQIFVSDDVTQKYPEVLAQLELHEVLGALKYSDRNYNLSTALNLLNQIEDPKVRQDLKKALERDLFKDVNRFASGSGTSVGGGGDALALIVKNRVLSEIMRDQRGVSRDFLTTYPEIAFEPFYEKDQQFVAIGYDVWRKGWETPPIPGVRINRYGVQEQIAFHFPAIDWQKKPWKRDAIIREIKDKVTNLFPAYMDSVMVPYVPEWCSEKTAVLLAKTQDAHMRLIQQIRASARNKCDGFVMTGHRFPSFLDSKGNASTERKWPEVEARLRTYNCALSFGGGQQNQKIEADPKYPGRQSHGIMISGETTAMTDYSHLFVKIDSDKRGKIVGLGLINMHKTNFKMVRQVYKEFKNDEALKIELDSLYVGRIRYQCGER